MAFRWRADDGPLLLGNPIFCDFQGGVQTPCPPPPTHTHTSGPAHEDTRKELQVNLSLKRSNQNPLPKRDDCKTRWMSDGGFLMWW